MENIIEISNLYKSYKEVKAVQDLSFCVKKGELFGARYSNFYKINNLI